MKIIKSLIIIIFVILCIITVGQADSYNNIDEKDTEEAAATPTASETDIAQIFITADQSISEEEYTAAKIVIADADGGSYETITDSEARIKIRGNSTATLAKKPYNIKLSTSQGILGMKAGKKWCLLANFMDTSLLRNKLAYDFAQNIGLDYSCETRYVDVWLNGEYQGNYLLTTPVETGEDRVDIDTSQKEFLLELEANRTEKDTTYISTELYRFKLDAPETLTQEQSDWLEQFLSEAEAAIKSRDYSRIKEYVDIDSFIDFYIVQELFKNMDVNTSSTRFYIKDHKIYAGPIWDFDLSSGNIGLFSFLPYYLSYNNYGMTGNASQNSYEGFWAFTGGASQDYSLSWIGNLMHCSDFYEKLYERYQQLQEQIVNLYQDNTTGTNQMDLLLEEYGDSFARNNEIWPVELHRDSPLYRTNEKTFEESVSYLCSWLKNRNEWLLEALKEFETGNCNLFAERI